MRAIVSSRVRELAAAGVAGYPALLAWLEGTGPDPEGLDRPSPAAPSPQPMTGVDTPATEPAVATLHAALVARRRAVAACPHRAGLEPCGCGGGITCPPDGRRPGQWVVIDDCAACLGLAPLPGR